LLKIECNNRKLNRDATVAFLYNYGGQVNSTMGVTHVADFAK